MSSISVHDARLPTLTSPNLRNLHSSKVDKDRFLRSYIRSQQAHLSSYALQGKSVTASWTVEETDAPTKEAATARDVELESGFGTPILKPRPATRKVNAQGLDAKQDHGRARQKSGKENKGTGSSASGEMDEEDVASRGERHDDRDVGDFRAAKRMRPKELNSTSTPKEKVPVGSRPKEKVSVSRKPSVQGRRDPESEEEHRNRLAERRERRRAKKAIVDPKPDPPVSDGSSHYRSGRKKRNKPNGKNGKGLSIPAGLALMHGFSATNIGKNRLTLEPAVGVFNKGKASAKTKVKKAKEKRPTSKMKMFSENLFLGKTKSDSCQAASTSSRSTRSNDHAKPEPESASPESKCPNGKAKSLDRKAQKRKRPRPSSTVDDSPDECEEGAPQDQARPVKKRKERAKSPVWDIELEDGQLPSDSHSDEHAGSESGTKVAGTLLLDTRAFSSRWAILKDKYDLPPTGPTIETNERVAEPRDDHGSDGASTIDPSHSASQVAYRGTAFSRFFPRPSGTQGESAVLPAAQPSSHQRNSLNDPDDTVQDRMVHPSWDMPGDSLDTLQRDHAEVLHSPPRAPSESPLVRDKSPLPVVSRPPSCASSNYRHEAAPGVSRADPCHGGAAFNTHPEYASSVSLNRTSSPLLPPISMGGLEPTDVEDQLVASAHDWTTEFLGLLGEEPPDDLFLSNVAGYAGSLERPIAIDDDDLGAYAEPTEEEELRGVNNWELESEDIDRVLCDPYLVEEDSYYGVDHPQEYALEDCGSASASRHGTPEEAVCDVRYPGPRKRVKFSGDVRCYEDDRDGADTDPGVGWKWQPDPDINDADGGELEEVGLSEFGDPDGRSAGTADPDPALSEANCQLDLAVAVEDESSEPEEDEGGAPSEMEEERSVLGPLQRFSQGRALLMGVASEIGVDSFGTRLGVSAMEEDVARNLRGHWQPQRF